VKFCIGQDIPAGNTSMELDYLQAPPMGAYILSRTSYLSEAQKERVMAFIQETKPQITVFVSVIGETSVQPPGPYLVSSLLLLNKHTSLNVNLFADGCCCTCFHKYIWMVFSHDILIYHECSEYM
jgi:hypothetical protein